MCTLIFILITSQSRHRENFASMVRTTPRRALGANNQVRWDAVDAPLEPDLRARVKRRRPITRLRRHVVALLLLVLHEVVLHI